MQFIKTDYIICLVCRYYTTTTIDPEPNVDLAALAAKRVRQQYLSFFL